MGHRLSKTTLSGSHVATNKSQQKRNSTKIRTLSVDLSAEISQLGSEYTNSSSIIRANLEQEENGNDLGPTINVITDTNHYRIKTRRNPNSTSSNRPRQIIIKIELAKMEPGENDGTSTPSPAQESGAVGSNNNLNVERSNLLLNAATFRRNITCDQGTEIKLNNLNISSSTVLNNNNFVSNFADVDESSNSNSGEPRSRPTVQNFNIMVRQMANCQLTDNTSSNNNDSRGSNWSSTSSSGFIDVVPDVTEAESSTDARADVKNHCCRRKKSAAANSASTSSSSAYQSKWRCCKCTCRDALKKFRPSSSKKQNKLSSGNNDTMAEMQPLAAALSSQSAWNDPLETSGNHLSIWSPVDDLSIPNEMPPTSGNHLAIWSPHDDIIIPLASPIVVVQCPQASSASHFTLHAPLDDHAIRLMTADSPPSTTPDSSNSMAALHWSTLSTATTPNGTVVHSQVDYIHCLVPDLERITKSTFYWGKMDRYEAERLLEGKPEGTFLLRDSAQEEYLFSVTFRKYGRSLHARIEQFNHRFSFDCHDPGVFTASTVTGLLEHYKDPMCVMFFEPMLTIPLHRNTTFSLQQLCRATIVSHTTYDGISELEIPSRLKSYLKEYHYKQRVRVKPFDDPFFTCT